MASNAQTTPLGRSLNQLARARAEEAIHKTGRSLPASVVAVIGSIVQVKFEIVSGYTLPNVTVPLIGSEYARPPIQVGCKGLVLAADAYLGGMSGLGGGVASLAPVGNLTALVFAPIGNTGWTVVDQNAFVLYGPNGVVLKDSNGAMTLTLTPSGIVINGPKIEINTPTINMTGMMTMTGTLSVVGELIKNGITVVAP